MGGRSGCHEYELFFSLLDGEELWWPLAALQRLQMVLASACHRPGRVGPNWD